MAWYSAVSGGFCARPIGLVGSKPRPRKPPPTLPARRHWPLKSGYLVSSWAAALPIAIASPATNAVVQTTVEMRVLNIGSSFVAFHLDHIETIRQRPAQQARV